MAPADTPGRKKRETQYFEVGVQGRSVKNGYLTHSKNHVAEADLTIDARVSHSRIVVFATSSASNHKKAYSHHLRNKLLSPCAMLAAHVKAMARQMARKTWMLEGVSWRGARQVP